MTPLVFIITAVIGGLGAPLIKFTLNFFSPVTLMFLRAALAAALILPFVYKSISWKEGKIYLITANILFAINWLVFAFGIERTTVIMGQMIYLLTPLIVATLGYFFLKEKLTLLQISGLIIALAGLLFLAYSSAQSQDMISFGTPLGNFLVFLGLISWSFYILISRKISSIYEPKVITFFNFLAASIIALFLIPIERVSSSQIVPNLTPSAYLGLSGVVLISSVSFFFLYQWLVKNTSAFISSLVLYPVTIVAATVGIIFFGERPTLSFFLGSILVFIGVFVATSLSNLKKIAIFRLWTSR